MTVFEENFLLNIENISSILCPSNSIIIILYPDSVPYQYSLGKPSNLEKNILDRRSNNNLHFVKYLIFLLLLLVEVFYISNSPVMINCYNGKYMSSVTIFAAYLIFVSLS